MKLEIEPAGDWFFVLDYTDPDDLGGIKLAGFKDRADAELFVLYKEMDAEFKARLAGSPAMALDPHITVTQSQPDAQYMQWVEGHEPGGFPIRKIPVEFVEKLPGETATPVYSGDLCPHCGGAVHPRESREFPTQCLCCFRIIEGDVQPPGIDPSKPSNWKNSACTDSVGSEAEFVGHHYSDIQPDVVPDGAECLSTDGLIQAHKDMIKRVAEAIEKRIDEELGPQPDVVIDK